MVGIRSAHELGPLVRGARRAAGLRQEDLALAANCSAKFLVDLEAGKGTAPFAKVLDVIAALGGSLNLAFPGSEETT